MHSIRFNLHYICSVVCPCVLSVGYERELCIRPTQLAIVRSLNVRRTLQFRCENVVVERSANVNL